MKKLSQRGESSMIVIGLIALVAICVATYFAYKQGQAHSLTLPSPSPTAKASTTPIAKANVLKIDQFGVEMTIPAGLTDVEYRLDKTYAGDMTGINPSSKFHSYGLLYFDSKQFAAAHPACSINGGGTSSLAVWDKDPSNAFASGPTASYHAGNYYFAESPHQDTCSGLKEGQTLQGSAEGDQIELFRKMFATLKAN